MSIRQKWAKRHSGFTLVEVTVCLGIVATAMLSVVALLAVAADTAREAAAETTCSQIAARIFGEVQLARFQDLHLLPGDRFFNEFGEEISSSTAGASLPGDANYTARLQLATVPGANLATLGTAPANTNLYQVNLYIGAAPGPVGAQLITDHLAGTDDRRVYPFSTVVANLEK